MQASQLRRWPALLLLPLLALSTMLLQGCSNSFAVVTRTPVIAPDGGTFSAPVSVTLTDATPSASIFYTLDGTTPTPASTAYTGPFTLSQSATVQAIATAPKDINSFIATATFQIAAPPPQQQQAATPTFNPPAGTYTSTQSVTISDTTPNAVIYYTTNGTTPTTASALYTAPIVVSTSETLEAIAVASGYTTSPVATAVYVINIPAISCANPAPGIICTVAGDGVFGFSGDGGAATSAELYNPWATALDASGNLYIADTENHRVRKVTPAGLISTVAGNGTYGFGGDGGPATSAEITVPEGIAVDSTGNLYIADTDAGVIREVTPAGIISTVAGGGRSGLGDGGPATSAELSQLGGVAVDSSGNLYIADTYDYRVRKVTPNGIISTIAGNGTQGFSGDGGPATSAQLSLPNALAVDSAGNLYISDWENYRIRKVTPSGIISTVAGNGTQGSTGDGGLATSAELSFSHSVAVDSNGNLYIADHLGERIRMVTPSGIISTVAGTGTAGFSGDGGPATNAELYFPNGVTVDSAGNLFIADAENNRIRVVVH